MKYLILTIFSVYIFASEIYVAAASNISYSMHEIVKRFNKDHPYIKVKLIYSSSGKLTAQIMHFAPYDLFLSADMKYPKYLYKRGFALTKPEVYAKGSLALFSIKEKNLSNFKEALKNASSIAIANPKTAPYGKAALEAIKNAGLYESVKDKLIFAETVGAVIPYTLNSADVGIVALSSMYSEKMKKYKNFHKVPDNLYTPIKQGIVLLKDKKDARMFYMFILSDRARKIFKKYGYND